jgi:hypothetical protein
VRPGSSHLGEMASPLEAAEEKRRAGENRAVEHVALFEVRHEMMTVGGPSGEDVSWSSGINPACVTKMA